MSRNRRGERGGCSTFFLMLLVVGVFGGVLWLNAQPAPAIAPVLPTEAVPTENPNIIPQLLSRNFGSNTTPLPTLDIPTRQPTRSVALENAITSTPMSAAEVAVAAGTSVSSIAAGATPTLAPATAQVNVQSVTRAPNEWQPPPLIPPLSRDPLGRDHFWLVRPVDSNANNEVLAAYPYGSDGTGPDPLRIHHGIDMPNPVGEEVRAAGSGTVLFAADGRLRETSIFQNSPSYGNVVLIEHDFGYNGQPIYTLYAHLLTATVFAGDVVEAGQVIGLIGNTGRVTGPHVHFQVHLGDNRYGDTVNPALWIVPYVGTGVIAGRVVDANGEFLDDVRVTIRNRATGLNHPVYPMTYVFADTVDDVNSDPVWQENFAVTDIPVGRYDVIAMIDGLQVVRQVDVIEGTTAFVELKPQERVDLTPTPTPNS